jgi:putative redox protein
VKAKISWQDGVSFKIETGSGHTIITDGPEESGGQNLGPRPMELVLVGVGACSSYDVVSILKKGREDVQGCVCEIQAERVAEPPRVFEHLNMHFVVSGRNLTSSKVERAVALSAEKYCSASIMLSRGGVKITHSFEVIEIE